MAKFLLALVCCIRILENTFVLPFSQNSLKKEAKEKKIYNLLLLEEYEVSMYDVKKHFDSISPHLNPEILKIIEIESNLDLIGKAKMPWNQKIKNLKKYFIMQVYLHFFFRKLLQI